jgi:hypothetical protein
MTLKGLNVPTLRHTSLSAAGTITVPAGQTWVVKSANADFLARGITAHDRASITASINGNSAPLWNSSAYGTGAIGLYRYGIPILSSTIIMKAGDTIQLSIDLGAPTIALSVYYYILEQDMGIQSSQVPTLRHTGRTTAGLITVPTGETWVIKTANAKFDYLGGTLATTKVISTINSNIATIWRASSSNSTSGLYAIGGPIFSSSMIMKASDTLELNLGGTSTSSLDLYYYIFEQDL